MNSRINFFKQLQGALTKRYLFGFYATTGGPKLQTDMGDRITSNQETFRYTDCYHSQPFDTNLINGYLTELDGISSNINSLLTKSIIIAYEPCE